MSVSSWLRSIVASKSNDALFAVQKCSKETWYKWSECRNENRNMFERGITKYLAYFTGRPGRASPTQDNRDIQSKYKLTIKGNKKTQVNFSGLCFLEKCQSTQKCPCLFREHANFMQHDPLRNSGPFLLHDALQAASVHLPLILLPNISGIICWHLV